MSMLFYIHSQCSNGYNPSFLEISSLVAILAGILVLVSKNPIISILFLIGLFISISGYLLLAGISFIGISYLVVYVGAVSILFLFILMLINIRVSELLTDTRNSIPLSIFTGILFSYSVYQILPNINYSNLEYIFTFIIHFLKNEVGFEIKSFTNDNTVYYATSNVWDNSIVENSHITSIGNIMYTNYSLWLILTSMILLLSMIGAILITYKPKVNSLGKSTKNYNKTIVNMNFSTTPCLKDPYTLTMAYSAGMASTPLMPLLFTYLGLIAASLYYIEAVNSIFTEIAVANPETIPVESFKEACSLTNSYELLLRDLLESIRIHRTSGAITMADLTPYSHNFHELLNASARAYTSFLDTRPYIESLRCVMSPDLLNFNSTGYYFHSSGPDRLFHLMNNVLDELHYPRLRGTNFKSYTYFLIQGVRN